MMRELHPGAHPVRFDALNYMRVSDDEVWIYTYIFNFKLIWLQNRKLSPFLVLLALLLVYLLFTAHMIRY